MRAKGYIAPGMLVVIISTPWIERLDPHDVWTTGDQPSIGDIGVILDCFSDGSDYLSALFCGREVRLLKSDIAKQILGRDKENK